MAEQTNLYTWVPFYQELADKLLQFKDKRHELIGRLLTLYEGIGTKLPKLDSKDLPADIDPYTVYGLFNKGITNANRKRVIAAIADEFGIGSRQPSDFAGIPVLNNQNATFYAFVGDERRGEHDIDNLWRVFEAGLALAADENEGTKAGFIDAYENAVVQFGIGWKLTMGLFWARPHTFVNLDQRNRWFLGDMTGAGQDIANVVPKEGDAPVHDGKRYLGICDAIRRRFGSEECPFADFPELSNAAFEESERFNKEKIAAAKASEKEAEDNALGDADVETVSHWLYAPGAGAAMWDDFYDQGVMGIGWDELGDLNDYATKADVRARLQEINGDSSHYFNSVQIVWQFVHDLKPGDVVYAKRGMSEIIGRGVVTGEYEHDRAGNAEYPNLRRVRWTHRGSWKRDKRFSGKALTDMTNHTDFVSEVAALFADDTADGVEDAPTVEHPAYGKDGFLAEAYMGEKSYDTLVGVLRTKKNVILQGAPGVGKTFVAKRLAYSLMGVKDPDRVMMVQFHQSYSYEDFIEGIRPVGSEWKPVKGAFYDFCQKAAEDDENDYFFIIDEINRGNLSKIFGELFMLIENDKRGPKNKLRLLYSRDLFYVPSNVFLIGMMNTADRSLAMLDYALRRRFAFFDLKPGFESDGFTSYREGLSSRMLDDLVACVVRLNEAIADDETLGEGFCIGHSYFCGLKAADVTQARLSAIVEYELVPMLREYWFDEPSKVREWSGRLRRAIR